MKRFLFITITLFLLVSCDDILEKEPLDMISDAVVWNDPILIDAYINNVYSNMVFLNNEDRNVFYNTAASRRYAYFNINNAADQSSQPRLWFWSVSNFVAGGKLDETGRYLESWNYDIIRKTNEFLEKIEDTNISNEQKNIFIGRVKLARALCYFAMVKRYGGVPLITHAQSIDIPIEELQVPRNTEKEVYDFILDECDEILDNNLLTDPEKTPKGWCSKYVVLALKSRAALYAASIATWGEVKLDGLVGIPVSYAQNYWQISYDASKKIIESEKYSLYQKIPNDLAENYRQMTIDENSNPEIIWAKYFDGENVMHMWDSGNGVVPWAEDWSAYNIAPYLEFIEEYEYKDGTPGGVDRSALTGQLWDPVELWKDKEPRFHGSIWTQGSSFNGINDIQIYWGIRKEDGTIVKTNSGFYQGELIWGANRGVTTDTYTGFYLKKGVDDKGIGINNKGTSQRIIFRYGEILLNFAESAFYLNKQNDALWAINEIRRRVALPEHTMIDEDKIRHERKIELSFEAHRYWDIRRWRIAHQVLNRNFSAINYILDYKSRKFLIEINPTYVYPIFDNRHYYLPITSNRIANNPKLAPENPGY